MGDLAELSKALAELGASIRSVANESKRIGESRRWSRHPDAENMVKMAGLYAGWAECIELSANGLAEIATHPQPVTPASAGIDFPQVGFAGPFPIVEGRIRLPDETMADLIHHARTGYVPVTPAEEVAAMDALVAAFNIWPADIRKKLSLHDLRRMTGWQPPVTPAGGEVVAYRYVADDGVYNPFVRDWLDGSPDRLDLDNIARHPGVRFEFAYSNPTVPDHELQQKWFRRGWDMYVELHGETHPPVADAALPRGHRISDAKQNPMASALVRMEGLAIRWYESAQNDKHEQRASAKQKCSADLRALIAALNQRGGG